MNTKQVMIFVDESEWDKGRKTEAQAEQLKREGFHLEPLTSGVTIKLQSIELDSTIRIPVAPKAMNFPLIESHSTAQWHQQHDQCLYCERYYARHKFCVY